MKKSKLILYILFIIGTTLNAEWNSISLSEHIERSSLIVIAEFKKELEKKETEMGTEQLVSLKVDETIKGEAETLISVKGQALEMCMPQMLFPNTPQTIYLLFLEEDDNGSKYNLVHGKRSALVVENRSVGWISDEEKIDAGEAVITSLEKVKEQIVKLEKDNKNKKPKEPIDVWDIYKGFR